MKKNFVLILMPLLILVILFWTRAIYTLIPVDAATAASEHKTAQHEAAPKFEFTLASYTDNSPTAKTTPINTRVTNSIGNSEEIISYAMTLLGSPYIYAGMSPNGFDCSGFVTYVFDKYGVDLPHSSAMQANEGIPVEKEEARTGDLVIFTGTDPGKREPGHVGIVISAPGDTIEFVHSSSNGGVKVSKVQGTRYDLRFLEVRRVL